MPQVKLQSGRIIDVHPVPPFAMAELERRHGKDEDYAGIVREVAWLIALDGLQVPDDWQFPRGLLYAGIAPRDEAEGRFLDYVEYGLLTTPADIDAVQAVMYGELGQAEVDAAEATFQPAGG